MPSPDHTPSSSPSRRTLLLWCGAATAGVSAAYLRWAWKRPEAPLPVAEGPGIEAPSTPARVETIEPPQFSHSVFSRLLRSEFELEPPEGSALRCRLVEVTPVRTMRAPQAEYSAFSLLFESGPGFPGDGAICRVTHPELAPMELFLSPVGRPKDGRHLLEAALTQGV